MAGRNELRPYGPFYIRHPPFAKSIFMRPCCIVNPNSGSFERFLAVLPRLEAAGGICWHTEGEGHAEQLARQAAIEGFSPVVAVGGDGTVNEVVNGLMVLDAPRPALGILPYGTGNDLARTLGLPLDAGEEAVETLLAGRTVPLDVFKVRQGLRARFGVNVAAGGFSGEVGEALTQDFKKQWGPLAYLLGAINVLPELEAYQTFLCLDGEEQQVEAYNLFVANGRSVAGGKTVAPLARVDDGLLDVIVVRAGTALEMAGLAARFLAGEHLASPFIDRYLAREVAIRSTPGLYFNVDGELLGEEPIAFEVYPDALSVVAGPDYTSAG